MLYDVGIFAITQKSSFCDPHSIKKSYLNLKLSIENMTKVKNHEGFTDDDGRTFSYCVSLRKYYIFHIDDQIAEIDDTDLFIRKCDEHLKVWSDKNERVEYDEPTND